MKTAAALFLAAALAGPTSAAETFEVGAYVKSTVFYFRLPAGSLLKDSPDTSGLAALSNRLRLRLTVRPSSVWNFQLAYDFSPRIQNQRLFETDEAGLSFSPPDYRLADPRPRLIPGPDRTPQCFGLFQNLDRLALTWRAGPADIIVGRQAVSWGSARIVNPTDVLSPFSFNEPDKEERRGVDAVRLRLALGDMDELDFGLVAGRNFSAGTSAAFIRGRTSLWKTDVSLLALAFRHHLLLGLDLAGSLGGAGVWLEAAFVFADAFREKPAAADHDYFRASLGLDINLSSTVYAFTEVHWSTAGAGNPDGYASLFDSAAFQDGTVYLFGRTYLGLGTRIQVHPLISATGLALVNANDGSFVLAPSLEANIAENIDLLAGLYLGIGRSPLPAGSTPAEAETVLRSEFGAYPDMMYASFRAYF